MTFQPTTWILVFVTLFVGFVAQGCGPSDDDGNARASQSEETSGQGDENPEVDRVGTSSATDDNGQSPTPADIDSKYLAHWISGTLETTRGKELELRKLKGNNLTQEFCRDSCIKWCACTAAVWANDDNKCELCVEKNLIFTPEEVEATDSSTTVIPTAAVSQETQNAPAISPRALPNSVGDSRRMLQYGKKDQPAPQVWIKARCGVPIHDLKVATPPAGNLTKTEAKREGAEMDTAFCHENCTAVPGCEASEGHVRTEVAAAATGYGVAREKNVTTCYHFAGDGAYLQPSETGGDAAEKEGGAEGVDSEFLTSMATCQLGHECTVDFLEGYVFADFSYDAANVANQSQIENITTAADCAKECNPANDCKAAVFVEQEGVAIACWISPLSDSLVPSNSSAAAPLLSDNYVFSGYLQNNRPDLDDAASSGRASPAAAPAVGAIIGAALAAVAVAVLAFVGFRAYKKHKGADAENAAETGSVATSSPKSARKRQAIE